MFTEEHRDQMSSSGGGVDGLTQSRVTKCCCQTLDERLAAVSVTNTNLRQDGKSAPQMNAISGASSRLTDILLWSVVACWGHRLYRHVQRLRGLSNDALSFSREVGEKT